MTSVEEPPAEEVKINSFDRVAGVLTAPTETFREISLRPDWLVPLMLVVGFSLVTYFVIAPHIDMASSIRQQLESRGIKDEKIIERQVEFAEKFSKFTAPITAVAIPISVLIMAGIVMLAFKLMGATGSFRQYFSITTYSWLPLTIKSVVMAGFIFTRDMVSQMELQTVVKSNLGFLSDPRTSPAVYAFLSSFDIFNLWTVFLLATGLAFASRFSRTRSAAILVVLWAIVILIKVGFASLAGGAKA